MVPFLKVESVRSSWGCLAPFEEDGEFIPPTELPVAEITLSDGAGNLLTAYALDPAQAEQFQRTFPGREFVLSADWDDGLPPFLATGRFQGDAVIVQTSFGKEYVSEGRRVELGYKVLLEGIPKPGDEIRIFDVYAAVREGPEFDSLVCENISFNGGDIAPWSDNYMDYSRGPGLNYSRGLDSTLFPESGGWVAEKSSGSSRRQIQPLRLSPERTLGKLLSLVLSKEELPISSLSEYLVCEPPGPRPEYGLTGFSPN